LKEGGDDRNEQGEELTIALADEKLLSSSIELLKGVREVEVSGRMARVGGNVS
jgi:hypothetical protein